MTFFAGCRDKVLEDGDYVLTQGTVLRDDCGLASGGQFATGTMRRTGYAVYFTLDQPAVRLSGSYRTSLEEFYLDGSLTNFSSTIRGNSCLLDVVEFHIDGVDTDERSFTGTLSMSTTTRQNDDCVCKLWFEFDAQRR